MAKRFDSKPLYKAGQRVKLRQLEHELSDGSTQTIPQEIGVLLGDSGEEGDAASWSGPDDDGSWMYIAVVDPEFATAPGDDGLREFGEEDIVEVLGEGVH